MANNLKIIVPRPLWRRPKNYSRNIAGNWTDMDDSLRLFSLQQLLAGDELPAKVRILKAMLGLPKGIFEALDNEQVSVMVAQLDWMTLQPSPVPILESFTHHGIEYHLPRPNFEDGCAIEFPVADRFLEEYAATNDERELLKLVATLARPLEHGQRAKLLNRHEAETRAEMLRGLPLEISIAVMLYFVGVKEFVSKSYDKWLFGSDDDDDNDEFEDADAPKFGWWGAYLGIAENGAFGNYEQVLQTNFHRIAMFLIEKKKENNRHKRMMEKQKNDSA